MAEDFLKKNNFSVTVIPTPREVTQSCGLSIKLNCSGVDNVKGYIKDGRFKAKAMFLIKRENGVKKIEKIG